jgi:hypothetical protein
MSVMYKVDSRLVSCDKCDNVAMCRSLYNGEVWILSLCERCDS